MSWCAYFTPFMFAYSPELIMQGDPFAIALRLAICLTGILMGTIAVVGYFQTRISIPFRIAYAGIALLLLLQPRMFDGAIWVNAAGIVLALAAITYEVMRGRAQRAAARETVPSS
jgi:TRAP-type uncharacterized transport system fused permease subunit